MKTFRELKPGDSIWSTYETVDDCRPRRIIVSDIILNGIGIDILDSGGNSFTIQGRHLDSSQDVYLFTSESSAIQDIMNRYQEAIYNAQEKVLNLYKEIDEYERLLKKTREIYENHNF